MTYGLFRILLYGLLFYLIYRVVRFFTALGRSSGNPIPQGRKTAGTMVKDEVCNTYLPKQDAIRLVHEGREHYFCSEDCKRKFLESHR